MTRTKMCSGGRPRLPAAAVVMALCALVACRNAGESSVLGIEASGVVGGFVYVDVNGSRRFELGFDTPLSNVLVRLLVRGTTVPLATGASSQSGEFTMEGVPVGNYVVDVDSTTVGDSVQVVL
ncbi:MAG: hypothetical protein ACYSUI_19815, partial [Planctomycetota bacterium]